MVLNDTQHCQIPFERTQNEQENKSKDNQREFRNLKTLLAANGVSLKQNPGFSQFRTGFIEALNKVFKLTLKRLGLYNRKFKFHELFYLCDRAAYLVNSRPLNVRFQDECIGHFRLITPSIILPGLAV